MAVTPSAGSKQVASVHADIGANTSGFEKGAASVKSGLKTLHNQFLTTKERTDAWNNGLTTSGNLSKQYGSILSEQANIMGLTGVKYQNLISASGIYSKEQLTAAQNSALVTEKARVLSGEVAKGAMTATQAGEAFKKYVKDLENTQYQSASTGKILQEMAGDFAKVGAVVGTLVIATKAIYDFSRAGAELQFAETRFDRLSDSIGTTSDVLLDDLREATRGIYDDATLMASAGDLMALGLAKTHDEAVRLSSVAAGLNMNMNQLVLTLTNKTTMRFDALGVSTDGFKEKLEELQKQGYSTDDAFKEAFLQQAEMQLEKVGHAADSNLGAFMQLEAQMKDTQDAAKELAANGLSPVIRFLAESTSEMNDNARALKEIDEGLYKEYSAHKVLTPEMERLIKQRELGAAMTDYYKSAVEGVTDAEIENAEAVKVSSDANRDLLGTIGDMQKESESFNEKYSEISNDQNLTDDERKVKLQELAAEHELYTRRVVLGLLEQKFMQDGILTDDEMNWLLEKGVAWGIYSDTVVSESRRAFDEANNLATALKNMPKEGTFTYFLNTVGDIAGVTKTSSNANQREQRRAGGGSVNAGQSYLVGERGMEMFTPTQDGTITPNHKLGSSGGNVTVNIMLDSGTPDPERVAYNLKPAVERVIRDMQRAGTV